MILLVVRDNLRKIFIRVPGIQHTANDAFANDAFENFTQPVRNGATDFLDKTVGDEPLDRVSIPWFNGDSVDIRAPSIPWFNGGRVDLSLTGATALKTGDIDWTFLNLTLGFPKIEEYSLASL